MELDLTAPRCAVHPSVVAVGSCPRCGAFACAACLHTGPEALGRCAACESREEPQLPWDQRDGRGAVRAFVLTSWRILTSPTAALRRAGPRGSFGSSLGFATLAAISWISSTMIGYGLIVAAIALAAVVARKHDASGLPAGVLALGGAAVMVGTVLVIVLLLLGSVLLGAGLDHLVLRMIGSRPKSFDVTLRAHALSYAPALLGVIPFCGPYIVPLWAAGLRVVAYRSLHQISAKQAAAGALLVPGVFLGLAFAGYLTALVLANAVGNS